MMNIGKQNGMNLNKYAQKVGQKTIVGPVMQNVRVPRCVDPLAHRS